MFSINERPTDPQYLRIQILVKISLNRWVCQQWKHSASVSQKNFLSAVWPQDFQETKTNFSVDSKTIKTNEFVASRTENARRLFLVFGTTKIWFGKKTTRISVRSTRTKGKNLFDLRSWRRLKTFSAKRHRTKSGGSILRLEIEKFDVRTKFPSTYEHFGQIWRRSIHSWRKAKRENFRVESPIFANNFEAFRTNQSRTVNTKSTIRIDRQTNQTFQISTEKLKSNFDVSKRKEKARCFSTDVDLSVRDHRSNFTNWKDFLRVSTFSIREKTKQRCLSTTDRRKWISNELD